MSDGPIKLAVGYGRVRGVVSRRRANLALAAIPENAIFETGDSWIAGGQRFRLYGVQACLRGTAFTNASGQRRDCGEASLAMLISLNRDFRPLCAPSLKARPTASAM